MSKQPIFKVTAVRLTKIADGGGVPAPAPTTTGSMPVEPGVPTTVGDAAGQADERLVGE